MIIRKCVPVLSLLVLFVFSSCSQNKGGERKGSPPIPVSVFEVQTGNATYYNTYPATAIALNQVEVRPEVSGYVTGIFFKDGQHVSKGMKLYGIDQQQYKGAYDVAKANLERARQDYHTYKDLAKNDAIARQVLDHALADLKAAESGLNEVETNLRNSVIHAPFSGTIGISQVKMGSSVTAGQTLLNTLSSDDPMSVDFAVDEKQINNFTDKLHKKVGPKDSTFTLVLPDQSIYPFDGRLLLLDRAVDPQTGTITARLVFPNPGNILRPGLTCNVRVLNNDTSKSIIIPYKAVVVQMGEYFVFIVNKDKTVSQQRIEIGRTINDDMVIVKSGLEAGREVVTEGVQKLRNGSLVVTSSSAKSGNAAKTSQK